MCGNREIRWMQGCSTHHHQFLRFSMPVLRTKVEIWLCKRSCGRNKLWLTQTAPHHVTTSGENDSVVWGTDPSTIFHSRMEPEITHSSYLCQSCSTEGANFVRWFCNINQAQIAFNPGPFGQKSLTPVSSPIHNGSAALMASLNQQKLN